MSRLGRRRGRAALLIAAGALFAGAGASLGEEPRLTVSVRGPTFEGGDATLEIELRRSLAEQPVTLTVTVDSEVVDRFDAEGHFVRHRFSHPLLTVGEHELGVRTGTERASTRLRVLSRRIPWIVGGGVLLLALGTVYAFWRRRRSAHRSGR